MLAKVFESANPDRRRPVLGADFETSLPGVHAIGELAGAPLLKTSIAQGVELADRLADLDAPAPGGYFDVVIAGAGGAGLSCGLESLRLGRKVLVLESRRVAEAIRRFPRGKKIYDEPAGMSASGPLWFAETTREQLLERWEQAATGLDIREGEPVTGAIRDGDWLRVTTPCGEYRTRRLVLATGSGGEPRRLGVPGEELPQVHHRPAEASERTGARVLVVGGGNSAAETALTLAEGNAVTLVHRGADLPRLTPRLRAAIEDHPRVDVRFGAEVERITPEGASMRGGGNVPADAVYVLAGAEPAVGFLREMGIRFENDWSGSPWLPAGLLAAAAGALAAAWWWVAAFLLLLLTVTGRRGNRWAWLALSFGISYAIYGVKRGGGLEFWPFTGWGADLLAFGGRPWGFWYTVLYTLLMTVFGIEALRRWGHDPFQRWRYACLIGFQWVFFFLIPEFLFRMAVERELLGAALAGDPGFVNNLWRSYGLVYAWPLFFHTFLGNPHKIWVYWGILLSFGILPLLVLLHGKRYCSWICGCGGLAETVGDRWRHLAPKGETARRWERMNGWVLGAAVAITLIAVVRDATGLWAGPADTGMAIYNLVVDVWLVGILPVGLYPFLGGKVWCRYWCPLAKMMELYSAWFTRRRWSRFSIESNDRCIACGECTRQCQVGIDVMRFALAGKSIDNANSSCIGCGICVTVCPMQVLRFGGEKSKQTASSLVQIT